MAPQLDAVAQSSAKPITSQARQLYLLHQYAHVDCYGDHRLRNSIVIMVSVSIWHHRNILPKLTRNQGRKQFDSEPTTQLTTSQPLSSMAPTAQSNQPTASQMFDAMQSMFIDRNKQQIFTCNSSMHSNYFSSVVWRRAISFVVERRTESGQRLPPKQPINHFPTISFLFIHCDYFAFRSCAVGVGIFCWVAQPG